MNRLLQFAWANSVGLAAYPAAQQGKSREMEACSSTCKPTQLAWAYTVG